MGHPVFNSENEGTVEASQRDYADFENLEAVFMYWLRARLL